MGNTIQRLAFPYPNPPYDFETEPYYIGNSRGDHIPVLYFPYKEKDNSSERLLIFSHGNATDLAASERFLKYLRDTFKISVLGYEYLGYGLSVPATDNSSVSNKSSPSEEGCYESLRLAWNYARKVLKIEASKIFLMGQSIGSGPTCEIAMRLCNKDNKSNDGCCASFSSSNSSSWSGSSCLDNDETVDKDKEYTEEQRCLGGMILISPFRSAAKVVTNSSIGYFVDFFQNECKIDQVRAPVLIIHGLQDQVIPYEHAEHLSNLCKEKDHRFCSVPYADHNDIFDSPETEQAISEFLKATP